MEKGPKFADTFADKGDLFDKFVHKRISSLFEAGAEVDIKPLRKKVETILQNDLHDFNPIVRIEAIRSFSELGLPKEDVKKLLDDEKKHVNKMGDLHSTKRAQTEALGELYRAYRDCGFTEEATEFMKQLTDISKGTAIVKRVFEPIPSNDKDFELLDEIADDKEKLSVFFWRLEGSSGCNPVHFEQVRKMIEQLNYDNQKIRMYCKLAEWKRNNSLPFEDDLKTAGDILRKSKNWSGHELYDQKTGKFDGYYGIDTTSSSENFEYNQGLAIASYLKMELRATTDQLKALQGKK